MPAREVGKRTAREVLSFKRAVKSCRWMQPITPGHPGANEPGQDAAPREVWSVAFEPSIGGEIRQTRPAVIGSTAAPTDDAKSATLPEYQTVGAASRSDAGGCLLLFAAELALRRRETRAEQGGAPSFAADSLQKQREQQTAAGTGRGRGRCALTSIVGAGRAGGRPGAGHRGRTGNARVAPVWSAWRVG